jgi:hypothetical protein
MKLNFAEVGDLVLVHKTEVQIDQIIFQEFYDDCGYIIEFVDTEGKYHHWKQELDGGCLIKI